MTSQAARRADGSKPVVGSSRKMSSGSPMRARAKSSRRRWPPRQPGADRARLPGETDQGDGLVDVPRRAIEPRVHGQAFADGQAGLGLRLLQDHAHPVPPGAPRGGRVGFKSPSDTRLRTCRDAVRPGRCPMGSGSGCPDWPRPATPDSLMTTAPTARLAHPLRRGEAAEHRLFAYAHDIVRLPIRVHATDVRELVFPAADPP